MSTTLNKIGENIKDIGQKYGSKFLRYEAAFAAAGATIGHFIPGVGSAQGAMHGAYAGVAAPILGAVAGVVTFGAARYGFLSIEAAAKGLYGFINGDLFDKQKRQKLFAKTLKKVVEPIDQSGRSEYEKISETPRQHIAEAFSVVLPLFVAAGVAIGVATNHVDFSKLNPVLDKTWKLPVKPAVAPK